MKLSFDKIRTVFGTKKTAETPLTENQIKNIIDAVDGDPFAISDRNVMFAKTSQLGGYFYVITLIAGCFKIKTMKGAKLSIEGHGFDLVLNSDSDEFESDHTNLPNRYVTRIDFQIEEDDVSKFNKDAVKFLKLSTKKKEIVFRTV